MKTNFLKILRWFTQKTTYVKTSKYKNNYIIYYDMQNVNVLFVPLLDFIKALYVSIVCSVCSNIHRTDYYNN